MYIYICIYIYIYICIYIYTSLSLSLFLSLWVNACLIFPFSRLANGASPSALVDALRMEGHVAARSAFDGETSSNISSG